MTDIHAEESHAAGEGNTMVQEQPNSVESAAVDAEKRQQRAQSAEAVKIQERNRG